MALDFTVRVVQPNGAIRVITRDDLAASIMAAGYAPGAGLQQIEFVLNRALDHLDNPPPQPQPQLALPAPTVEPPSVA